MSEYPILKNKPIDQLKVTELKDELRRRKISVTGLKHELVRKLDEALRNEMAAAENEVENNDLEPYKDCPDDGGQIDKDLPAEDAHDITADAMEKPDKDLPAEDAHAITADAIEKPDKDLPAEDAHDITADAMAKPDKDLPAEDAHDITADAMEKPDKDLPAEDAHDITADAMAKPDKDLPAEDAHDITADAMEKPDNDLPAEDAHAITADAMEKPDKDLPAEDAHDINSDAMKKPENDAAIIDIDGSIADVGQDIKDQDGETIPVSGEDTVVSRATETVVPGATEHAMSVEENAAESQNTITRTDSNHLDSTCDEKVENLNAAVEDTNHSLSKPDNQVPVVSPDLGSQVKSEFISTDSVSIIEKNKLKDNLNSDNFHLELEVKPEMVQPSSSTIPLLGGDFHPENDGDEQVKGLSSLEDIDAKNITDLDHVKKEDSMDVDEGSPEKLNLDRSSGDESMEEDLLETKSAVPSIEFKDLKEPIDEISKAPAGEEQSDSIATVSVTVQVKTDYIDEDKIKPTAPLEKRKLEDNAAVVNNEPVKRQRRWNLETVKLPEQQTSELSTSSTPKDAFQPTHKPIFTRTDSKLSEDFPKERIVPPSHKPATNSLRIDKFVRPFTLKAVQEMLSKTGTICSFWMDHIKTHCYVTFETVEQATATRDAVYNLRWPTNGGNLLIAEFVDPQEVKARAEAAPPQSPAPISPNPGKSKAPHFQQPQPEQARQNSLQQLPPPPPQLTNPPARERLLPPPPLSKMPEPPALTLDDLFKKTKTTPRVYYLPLTDEQVAAKLAAQAGNTRE